MPVCWRVCTCEQCVCVWFQKVEEWESLPCDTNHLCHSCFIYDMITNIHKCTNTHPHITKSLATALSACEWLDSPRGLDGLRDTVTVSQDPRRQPWDKKLIITPRTPRWMAGGHAMMRRKEWKRGNRPEAYCGDGEISTSATVATQTGKVYHTQKCIRTHTAEKATQMGSSVTSDYPPATLTWRDWGHMNASVALSDV